MTNLSFPKGEMCDEIWGIVFLDIILIFKKSAKALYKASYKTKWDNRSRKNNSSGAGSLSLKHRWGIFFFITRKKKNIQRIIAGVHGINKVYNWMHIHVNKLHELSPPSIPLDFIIVQKASYIFCFMIAKYGINTCSHRDATRQGSADRLEDLPLPVSAAFSRGESKCVVIFWCGSIPLSTKTNIIVSFHLWTWSRIWTLNLQGLRASFISSSWSNWKAYKVVLAAALKDLSLSFF